jgi:hypothetical protein
MNSTCAKSNSNPLQCSPSAAAGEGHAESTALRSETAIPDADGGIVMTPAIMNEDGRVPMELTDSLSVSGVSVCIILRIKTYL